MQNVTNVNIMVTEYVSAGIYFLRLTSSEQSFTNLIFTSPIAVLKKFTKITGKD